jgi:hypothetical protein
MNTFAINNDPFLKWTCESVEVVPTGLRGFVKFGQWWMDYREAEQVVNVCIASMGTVQWDKPINVMHVKTMVRE